MSPCAQELFCPARLPHKPYCSNSKAAALIRPVDIALGYTHIQFNPPTSFNWMVFDIDFECPAGFDSDECVRAAAYMRAASHYDNKNAPAPNYIVINPRNGHAHFIYCLKTPVARGENARLKPQRWYKSIYNRLASLLNADPGYSGVLCRNPLHFEHLTYKPCSALYELSDLEEYIKDVGCSKSAKTPVVFDEARRNTTVFDFTRTWIYSNINQFSDYDGVYSGCLTYAESINIFPQVGNLSLNEIKCIARSVAKYAWKNRADLGGWQEAFSKRQAWRGKRNGLSKRVELLAETKRLYAEGLSYRAIGERLGISFRTVGNWLAREHA